MAERLVSHGSASVGSRIARRPESLEVWRPTVLSSDGPVTRHAAVPPAIALSLLALLTVARMVLVAATPARLVAQSSPPLTLSIVGTNDLHGYVFPFNNRGGLALLGGYMANLRAARAADGGAVVLLDAGDTFQGGIESNLSEGALVIDAYNALGYTAAAIGNHEFDFGPLDTVDPADGPDTRGALKAIAARARFPLLAANLLDASTGRLINWPHVKPSTLVSMGGLRVGIIGAMTIDGLRATLAANVHGLALAPLAPSVLTQAQSLRAEGADVVLLTVHAGGRCSQFSDPADLSSCDDRAEIVGLLRDLPRGTLDGVVAGHTHAGIAHVIEGVPVIESLWGGRAFGRMDLSIDRETRRVVSVQLFPPHDLCPTQHCSASSPAPAEYEGRPVLPDPATIDAMQSELERVRRLQSVPLPVTVDTLVRRGVDAGAPLGNLFADALRESTPGADISINNNGFAGLRADLPAGLLTFGRLYDVFPFDNRVVRLSLTGAQLERVFLEEYRRARPGALSVSGVRVGASCDGSDLRVHVTRTTGANIGPDERLSVVTSDMLAAGAVFAPVSPPSAVVVPPTAPLVRTLVERWLRRRGGHLSEDQFLDRDGARWSDAPSSCLSASATPSPTR